MRRLIATLSLALAAPLAAQGTASIDPGMTRSQVLERLGRPSGERTAGTYTYLFYQNGCQRECGNTPDLVILREGAVADAVFRTTARRYTGTSTSSGAPAPMRSPDAPAVGTEGVTEARPAGARIPTRGGLVTGRGPATQIVRDPAPTPGMSVAPSRRANAARGDSVAATDGPERMNPRDSLSPRIDERATHEPHAADNQQERGTPAPSQRGLTLAPLSPAGPGVPVPAVTGVRPNPVDSARAARQRALQRSGQGGTRPDTTRRDTASTRPPNE